MEKAQPLRGMKDLYGKAWQDYQYITDAAYNLSKLYGYSGISTPLLEQASVFDRTLGETSDVVSKEIYCFNDKKGRTLALRPEFTASIMRALLSNNLHQQLPAKLFSAGPVFRYDRPQEGRQRQFHQLNFEYIGASGAHTDAEIIELAANLLKAFKIEQAVTLEISSLGCSDSRQAYQQALVVYFNQYQAELSQDSQTRLHKNPLRILDSKDKNDQKIAAGAPTIQNFYTKSAQQYFEMLLGYLTDLNIAYQVNPKLVRGLDYYCHTAFEFTTNQLGAQGTIAAGGRYDGLAQIMGASNEIPAIGFAAGIERIMLLGAFIKPDNQQIIILPLSDDYLTAALQLAQTLRSNNLSVIVNSEGKLGKRLQKASKQAAKAVIFVGEDEISTNKYLVKILATEQEYGGSISEILNILSTR